ncbi:GRIP1-associated protein 1-like protein [Dinothrombium tinctorium]|uniref:GRIP1-associated protein 1-like protein n=1 Tax=Dinothrombium tinctorium TaxID=1965070 RepID=A0A3S3NXZ7_9ACAR|nr:GRIP1-associated protein 1-like protein [Dinothrombium tinctorium]RWS07139.1 GRIP1-associated protein 1-like protein [Dinothrombium tinctorium]RWS08144.1 GRIP1-associated protein 1-like protein [Dinothrombium tinctorium]RWS08171.1 GRIP1-associated protein 1-like protein [Dinothrombium tinctorium]
MSSSLSEEEFQRLQPFYLSINFVSLFSLLKDQLLELKTTNYSFEDKIKKYENEITFWKSKCDNLEKQSLNPLSFARNLTRNSSKDRELIEKLTQENNILQQKIVAQENEFKLTNEMLRQEIAMLLKAQEASSNEESATTKANTNIGSLSGEDETAKQLSYAVLAEKEQLESKINALNQQVHDLSAENENINSQLKEMVAKVNSLENLKEQLRESSELCEKRKNIIDEMRAHIDDLKQQKINEINELKVNYEKLIADLEAQLKDLLTQNENLKKERDSQNTLSKELEIMLTKYNDLEKELVTTKEELKTQKDESNRKFERLIEENDKELKTLLETNEKAKIELVNEIEELKSNISSKEQAINDLHQQVVDIIEERKIHEKKGLMMVKELKRQLHSERKRAEKLQEKLQEALNEKSISAVTVDIHNKSQNGNDSSSVGSWSFMSSKENVEAPSVHSSSDSKQASPVRSFEEISSASVVANGSQLEQENAQLVSRITELQQEKWTLEERINQLEMNYAKLTVELNEKKQLIDYYCIEGRCDFNPHPTSNMEKLTVKRVFDFIKAKGDETQKDINRRLLRMLEETLTKNMHLEQNLEMLSRENVRLANAKKSEERKEISK